MMLQATIGSARLRDFTCGNLRTWTLCDILLQL